MEQYDDEEAEFEEIVLDSTLEVIYSPQRVLTIENSQYKNNKSEDSDENKLEIMFKKAIDNEQYELASKIKEVIKLQNNSENSDIN